MKVAVIGGGIAGLAAGEYLKNGGLDPVVFETADRAGGKMVSRRLEGCLLEGGPDSLLTEKPWAIDLCRELGLEGELLPSNDAQRSFSILHRGRLHPFPAGCKLFIPQRITPILTTRLLSIPGKLRMGMEPLRRHRAPPGDESLADFTRRHFGAETLERLAGPLLGGIYGGDPEDMSMTATFPRLQALERKHGSLVRGMAAMMREISRRPGPPPALFTALTSGMQILPDTLAARLGDRLRLRTPVTSLRRLGGCWEVNGESFDQVVIALPARVAASLCAEVDAELARGLAEQRSSSSATLSLVFDRAELRERPTGFGFMSAHPLTNLLVGCTWTGNKFSGREAENRFLCRLFLGGPGAEARLREAEDADLIDEALSALRAVCPWIPASPRAVWLQRWLNGNPGYRVGHPDWLAALRQRGDALGGLHFCGSSYDGVSVSDCVRQARDLAAQLSGAR